MPCDRGLPARCAPRALLDLAILLASTIFIQQLGVGEGGALCGQVVRRGALRRKLKSQLSAAASVQVARRRCPKHDGVGWRQVNPVVMLSPSTPSARNAPCSDRSTSQCAFPIGRPAEI